MTETMTVAEIITAATALVTNYQAIIWVGAVVAAGTMILRRIRGAAR